MTTTGETVTVGEVMCPGCKQTEFTRYDGDYWTTCRACHKQYSPGAVRKAAKRAKQGAR